MSNNIPPPSPAGPRSNSTGPNGTLSTPTTAAVVNGVGPAAGASAPAAASNAPLSQQNLNQIVSERPFGLSKIVFICPGEWRHVPFISRCVRQ